MNTIANASTAPAGPQLDNRRILAGVIDLAIILAGGFALSTALALATGGEAGLSRGLALAIAGWALYYHFAFESADSQTAGKKLMNLRVVRVDGAPLEMRDVARRTLLRVVDGPLVPLIGLIVMMVTGERRQRVGDLVAGTMVVDASAGQADPASVVEAAPGAEAEAQAEPVADRAPVQYGYTPPGRDDSGFDPFAPSETAVLPAEPAPDLQPFAPAPDPQPFAPEPDPQPFAPEPVGEFAPFQEPVAPEPVYEQPVAEQPVFEQPVFEQPAVEDPVAEELAAVEAFTPEPVFEEPVVEEAPAEQSFASEPVIEEPAVEDTPAERPVVDEPVVEESYAFVPIADESAVEEPVVGETFETEPVAEEPVAAQPHNAEPTPEESLAALLGQRAPAEEPVVPEPEPESSDEVTLRPMEIMSAIDMIMAEDEDRDESSEDDEGRRQPDPQ